MAIEYRNWITRDMVRTELDKLFVFGDNFMRIGMGGQAGSMRGEPNAVGIPTKFKPSMDPDAFFTEEGADVIIAHLEKDFRRLFEFEGVIVWPADGIGTGLAKLPEKAPTVWAYIEEQRLKLERK